MKELAECLFVSLNLDLTFITECTTTLTKEGANFQKKAAEESEQQNGSEKKFWHLLKIK